MQMAALALREKVIPGVDHSVDLPSTYDVEEFGVSNSHTISAFNESAYHPTVEELDVKLPASMKAQDILLSPPTAPDRFGFLNNTLCHRMSTIFMYLMTTTT